MIVGGLAFLVTATLVGCGPSPAYPRARGAATPSAAAACGCDDDDADDDDDEARPATKPVEYVKLHEWRAPSSVQEVEAVSPPRGDAPATYTTYPTLTLHEPIPGTTVRSMRRHRHPR
ncbi:MAG: hypothetical protein JST00_17030 [Deltaproteobacteria bacterium]|nr:hypothetical protein [Deltaproteobacteria bacterium]